MGTPIMENQMEKNMENTWKLGLYRVYIGVLGDNGEEEETSIMCFIGLYSDNGKSMEIVGIHSKKEGFPNIVT